MKSIIILILALMLGTTVLYAQAPQSSQTPQLTPYVDDCVAHLFSVESNSETVVNGKTLVLTLDISGGNFPVEKFQWHVTNGNILDGQGTKMITVLAEGVKDESVIAVMDTGWQT